MTIYDYSVSDYFNWYVAIDTQAWVERDDVLLKGFGGMVVKYKHRGPTTTKSSRKPKPTFVGAHNAGIYAIANLKVVLGIAFDAEFYTEFHAFEGANVVHRSSRSLARCKDILMATQSVVVASSDMTTMGKTRHLDPARRLHS